jgi:hypothetical protein
MSLNASKAPAPGPRTPPLEAGTYPGRLVQVIDLGMQKQRPWQGQEKPPAHMISLTYELVDEFLLDEDDQEDKEKPRFITEEFVLFNLASERAKSTARYNALDPEGISEGDFSDLLETPVNITIVQNPTKDGRIFNNIASISTMRNKDRKRTAELVNKPKMLDLDDPDLEVFLSLPDWIKTKIKDNLEFEGSILQKMLKDVKEDAPVKGEKKEKPGQPDEDENPY